MGCEDPTRPARERGRAIKGARPEADVKELPPCLRGARIGPDSSRGRLEYKPEEHQGEVLTGLQDGPQRSDVSGTGMLGSSKAISWR